MCCGDIAGAIATSITSQQYPRFAGALADMQAWLKADLWEKEVGHLADCSSRCFSQGLLADALYVLVLQANNRQHAMWPACIHAHPFN